MSRAARCLFAILLLAAVPAVAALEFDLAADFSTVTNPFGSWVLWRAPGMPFPTCQPDYMQDRTDVRAWADQPFPLPMHVPVWGPGLAGTDYVWAHGAEFDRTGTNVTSAVWTAPAAGMLTITGSAWQGAHNYRSMRWQLWHGEVLLTGGDITTDGTWTFEHPFDFAAGTGGPGALVRDVALGDRLELRLTSLSEGGNLGDSLLLRLHLSLDNTSPAPLPTPVAARLLPPQPNPFNPCTQLRAEVTRAGAARLAVFDLAGRCVRVLVDASSLAAGPLAATWDGRDAAGRACPSGRYVARLTSAGGDDAVGLTLVR
jgi:hypothetical protein